MEEHSKFILVTWDFTDKSVFALEHAINLAKIIHYDIALINIVKKDSEVAATEKKIAEAIREKFENVNVKPKIIVKAGTIFATIAELAAEINAQMVVMGTHGIRGMQKVLGSWALKVIAGSKSPFIVVQDSPKSDGLRNIVLPITFKKENKECINWANYFSRRFGTKFHILRAKNTDPRYVKGVESNIYFINKFFNSKNIRFDIQTASAAGDFAKETVNYAREIDADAILVMTTRDIGFTDYVLGAQEQYIIANTEKIPVICINPRPMKIGGSFSTSGG
jgi:nucleotide-binding universal stress UspA family protein